MDVFKEYVEPLKRIGFTGNEAKVYLTLIKLGSSKAGSISKYANIDRSSTYNAIKTLLQKGIVSYVLVGKTKWFQAASSRNIVEHLAGKVEKAKEISLDLEKIYKESKLKENVSLFKGKKGIKTVFEDIIKHADENLIFGSEGQFSKEMPLFAKQFTQKMENKGIKVKSIIRTKRKKEEKVSPRNKRTIPLTSESNVVTNIYAGKIAIIIWSETPEAILIENKKASDAYRDYFKYMWKYAKK